MSRIVYLSNLSKQMRQWLGSAVSRLGAGMPFALQHAVVFGFVLSLVVLRSVYKMVGTRPRKWNRGQLLLTDGEQAKRPGVQGSEKSAIEPLDGFDWKSAEPRKFRPFKPVYRINMSERSPACAPGGRG